jgi:beta-barrel assembly-enhancing protease
MQKVFLQFIITLLLFFAVWFSLSKVSFINQDQINKVDSATEKKIGELILKAVEVSDKEFKSRKLTEIIDTLKTSICKAQGVDPNSIRTVVIRKEDVNAFALPDRQIVIYSGLIKYSKGPEEVAGVLAHELGHIEKNHVMKKLVKELGLAMIITLAGNNSGFEIVKEAARTLSSSAFDRKQEEEADDFAFDTMVKANIDPENLANFLFRLSKESNNVPEELVWISTHPDTKERAAEILQKKGGKEFKQIPLIKSSWFDVQSLFKEQ